MVYQYLMSYLLSKIDYNYNSIFKVSSQNEPGSDSNEGVHYTELQNLHYRANIYIHQFYVDTGFHLKDLPKVMAKWDRWQQRESKESILSVCLDDDESKVFFKVFFFFLEKYSIGNYQKLGNTAVKGLKTKCCLESAQDHSYKSPNDQIDNLVVS